MAAMKIRYFSPSIGSFSFFLISLIFVTIFITLIPFQSLTLNSIIIIIIIICIFILLRFDQFLNQEEKLLFQNWSCLSLMLKEIWIDAAAAGRNHVFLQTRRFTHVSPTGLC